MATYYSQKPPTSSIEALQRTIARSKFSLEEAKKNLIKLRLVLIVTSAASEKLD